MLSERTEPPDFQALPQPTPETPEPGLEMPPGATKQSTLGLRVKEESEVTEEPGKGRWCASASKMLVVERTPGVFTKSSWWARTW